MARQASAHPPAIEVIYEGHLWEFDYDIVMNGKYVDTGFYGQDLKRYVTGVPRAEGAAERLESRRKTGFYILIAGLSTFVASYVGGIALASSAGEDEGVFGTAFAVMAVGVYVGIPMSLYGGYRMAGAREHFFDAVNEYNRAVPGP